MKVIISFQRLLRYISKCNAGYHGLTFVVEYLQMTNKKSLGSFLNDKKLSMK